MKKLIITLCLLLAGSHAIAVDFSDRLKTEFKEAEYGLHLISMHVPNTSTNNGNLGAYVITKNRYVLNTYYNSYHTMGFTVGWQTPEFYRFSATLGAVYGYKQVSGLLWTPAIIPMIRVATFEKPWAGVDEFNVRVTFAPNTEKLDFTKYGGNAIGLWHLAVGFKF